MSFDQSILPPFKTLLDSPPSFIIFFLKITQQHWQYLNGFEAIHWTMSNLWGEGGEASP